MRLLALLLLAFFALPARAEVRLELRYFVDESARLTPGEVIGKAASLPWVTPAHGVPSLGNTRARAWVHAKVAPGGLRFDGKQSLFFEITDGYLGLIRFFRVSRGRIVQTMEAGTSVPISRRDVDVLRAGFTVFRVNDPVDLQEDYFFSLEGPMPLSFPVAAWEAPDFPLHHWLTVLFIGLYLGCLILAAASNLVIGFSLRSRIYFLYAAYVVTVIFFTLSATGLSVQLLWPESPWWASHEVIILGCPALLFYVGFLREFLGIRRFAPVLDRLILFCCLLMVVRTVWICIAFQPFVASMGMTASAVANLLVIPVAWKAMRKKARGARFVYASSLIFNLSIVIFTGQLVGAIWLGDWAKWAPFVGLLVEVVLLSLALADRIRQANRELSAQRDAMVQADKIASLGRMAGEIAHEISNPLAIIHGNAVLISREAQLPHIREFAGTIEKTANRISKVVKGMRALSRDSRRDPFQATTLDSILQDAQALCLEKARMRGVSVELPASTPSLSLLCRGSEVCQVLVNLLSNAFDALEGTSEPRVRIEAARKGGEVEISVVDNGPGVPGGLREQILEPFFTTKPPGKGLGLGLSISRKIVEVHGGKLWLDEKAGQTRFVFTIPAAEERETAPPVERKS